jgi:hypothetical protein
MIVRLTQKGLILRAVLCLVATMALPSCRTHDGGPGRAAAGEALPPSYETAFHRLVAEWSKCEAVHHFGLGGTSLISFPLPTSVDGVLAGGQPCVRMLERLSQSGRALEASLAADCLRLMRARTVMKGPAERDARTGIEYALYCIPVD